MCGNCGILRVDGAAVDRSVLRALDGALVHRGPESHGAYIEGSIGLAMRRLAVIDLAGGDQPIANEARSVQVIENAEIDNYPGAMAG